MSWEAPTSSEASSAVSVESRRPGRSLTVWLGLRKIGGALGGEVSGLFLLHLRWHGRDCKDCDLSMASALERWVASVVVRLRVKAWVAHCDGVCVWWEEPKR